jgi:hypothetical protein
LPDREADNPFKAELIEAEVAPGPRGLAGDALAPELRRHPPADFHGSVRENRHVSCRVQAAKPASLPVSAISIAARPKPVLAIPSARRSIISVRVRTAAAHREELHDPVIRVDQVKQLAVALPPVPQDQAFCSQRSHGVTKSVLR